jgi:hypothetical protein
LSPIYPNMFFLKLVVWNWCQVIQTILAQDCERDLCLDGSCGLARRLLAEGLNYDRALCTLLPVKHCFPLWYVVLEY